MIQGVLDTGSVDDALAVVTEHLSDRYALWRTGFWRFIAADAVRLEAVWAVGDTSFEVGLIVNLSLTPDVGLLASSVREGRPVLFRTEQRDLGLLTDMLHAEGVASIVLAPLGRAPRQPVALLALGSSRDDVFQADDVRYVHALADGIGVKIDELLAQGPSGVDT